MLFISEYFIFYQVFFIDKQLLESPLGVVKVSLGVETVHENLALVVYLRCAALEPDRASMSELPLCDTLLDIALLHSHLSLDLYGKS